MKLYFLLIFLFLTACADLPNDTSDPYYGNYVGEGFNTFDYNNPEYDYPYYGYGGYGGYGSMNENPYFGGGQYLGGFY